MRIRNATPEDMLEIATRAKKEWDETMRPNKSGPRWNRFVSHDYPIYRDLSLGNMTQYRIAAFFPRTSNQLFVGVERKGAYTFEGEAHWSMSEKNSVFRKVMRVISRIGSTLNFVMKFRNRVRTSTNPFLRRMKSFLRPLPSTVHEGWRPVAQRACQGNPGRWGFKKCCYDDFEREG